MSNNLKGDVGGEEIPEDYVGWMKEYALTNYPEGTRGNDWIIGATCAYRHLTQKKEPVLPRWVRAHIRFPEENNPYARIVSTHENIEDFGIHFVAEGGFWLNGERVPLDDIEWLEEAESIPSSLPDGEVYPRWEHASEKPLSHMRQIPIKIMDGSPLMYSVGQLCADGTIMDIYNETFYQPDEIAYLVDFPFIVPTPIS